MFAKFNAYAEPYRGKVKITAIKALQLRTSTGNSVVKIETDAGLVGWGEAGSSGPMARARIKTMERFLIGRDPLAIEKHFHEMTSLMHTYVAHIPTISGIDIALWDLAGKITGLPVVVLLGGPFRDAIAMYSHGDGTKLLDKAACREWAARIKAAPEGFTAFKISIDPVVGVPSGRYATTLTTEQVRRAARGYMNAREAVGEEIDVAVHGHGELDTPSAIAVAKAVEPMNPLFFEDAINVAYSEGWAALKRSTRIPILTGEKLEMVAGFRPFLDRQACDIIHPDLAFAGGLTGTKKIADYAQMTRTPVALHNVGSLVLTYASAHFGAAIHNFYRSESALGRPTRQVEDMAASNPPQVKNGALSVPMEPGLGCEINVDFLKKNMAEGEPWWG
jgi:galactonate dehydratase